MYFKRRSFSLNQVIEKLEEGLWPDGTRLAQVRLVRPDEPVGIYLGFEHDYGGGQFNDPYQCAEFYGPEPIRRLGTPGIYHKFMTANWFGAVSRFTIWGDYYFLPDGCIVAQFYPDEEGNWVYEYIISTNNHPQLTFDFNQIASVCTERAEKVAA